KEKILLEEKLEDIKILNIRDGMKEDYFPLNKKRKVLTRDNLKEAKKVVLLYAECGCSDYRIEDTKEIISLFNKKEKIE
ncbi:36322_t:CDS:2, partial [Gigaspora margarita]